MQDIVFQKMLHKGGAKTERGKSKKIAYARVSTDDQNLDLQMDALTKAGCERIFNDQGVSGATI
jgi:predicted site-specific integrase-resolvase